MKNATKKQLTEKLWKLTPKKGYAFRSKISGMTYSEAITSHPEKFEAIKKAK